MTPQTPAPQPASDVPAADPSAAPAAPDPDCPGHDGAAVAARRPAGRRPQFSVDDVVRVTLAQGLASFSVAAVARDLGVTTAAVYRRFPSHRALQEYCLDRVLAEIPPLDEEIGWQDALTRAAAEWWTLCLRYPELPQVVSGYPGPVARFITGPFSTYGARLTAAGFTVQKTYFTASLLISALNQVSRLPVEGRPGRNGTGLTRDALRDLAVEVIVTGMAADGPDRR